MKMIVKFCKAHVYVNLANCIGFKFTFGNPVYFEFESMGREQIIPLMERYDVNHWEEFNGLVRENLDTEINKLEISIRDNEPYYEFAEI
jgi:hypothetical protein